MAHISFSPRVYSANFIRIFDPKFLLLVLCIEIKWPVLGHLQRRRAGKFLVARAITLRYETSDLC